MIEYKVGERVLARRLTEEDWGDGLNFCSRDEEFVQVGLWKYPAGKDLAAHEHNRVERQANRTQEVLFIRRGRLGVTLYDHDREVEEFTLEAGEILILLSGGHGYRVLEDGTQVLEVKNGPYPGAEADRRRLHE